MVENVSVTAGHVSHLMRVAILSTIKCSQNVRRLTYISPATLRGHHSLCSGRVFCWLDGARGSVAQAESDKSYRASQAVKDIKGVTSLRLRIWENNSHSGIFSASAAQGRYSE